MKPSDLGSLSLDELWALRERVDATLAQKIAAEKVALDQRLCQLSLPQNQKKADRARRPYPPVFPKYMNPAQPSETWAGRGRLPRWVEAQLKSGKQLNDFRIPPSIERKLGIVHQH